jgi:arylsulfatase A
VDEAKKGEPFFLFLPYILPHAELVVPDDSIFQYYKGKFPEKPHKGDDYGPDARPGGYASQEFPHAAFAAMVSRLDLYVGQVLDKLKEKGLDENTLFIFTSDNGPHLEAGADPLFFNSGGGFKGFKRDLYEGGIREPFVARWPGVVKPGTKNQYIGAFWDILPTFVELAGGKTTTYTDGISFVPALTGKGSQQKHEYLYWEFHEKGGKQAVRQGNWKAIRLDADKNSGRIELYDLSKDPAEQVNIADQNRNKVEELGRLMDRAHVPSAIFPFGNERK